MLLLLFLQFKQSQNKQTKKKKTLQTLLSKMTAFGNTNVSLSMLIVNGDVSQTRKTTFS